MFMAGYLLGIFSQYLSELRSAMELMRGLLLVLLPNFLAFVIDDQLNLVIFPSLCFCWVEPHVLKGRRPSVWSHAT